MGKRAKLSKIGNNKAYNTVVKSRRKNKLAKVFPQAKENIVKETNEAQDKLALNETPKLRLRRIKDRTVLSRGQKRRKIQKLRLEIRRSLTNKVKPQKIAPIKNSEKASFNLKDVDNMLMDVFEENSNNTNKKAKKPTKISKKDIISNEKDKIFKAIDNKNFNNNPFETIKSHIAKDLYMKEKNKLITEHLNKMDAQIKSLK